jgi:hypothetical protein
MMNETVRGVLRGQLLESKQPVTEASEPFIKAFPKNTDIYPDGLHWSSWDGYLALVSGPTYGHYSSKSDFDPVSMHRRYAVRYAIDFNKKKVKAERGDAGQQTIIRNPSLPYEKTTWAIGKPGYGPVREGTFEKKVVAYWVKVQMKDLYPGEITLVKAWMDEDKFFDATTMNNPISQSQWKKVLPMTFKQTQEQDYKIANAVNEVVEYMAGKFVGDDDEADRIWKDVGGIYKLTKKYDRIMFILTNPRAS